jgi:hypothetical protein
MATSGQLDSEPEISEEEEVILLTDVVEEPPTEAAPPQAPRPPESETFSSRASGPEEAAASASAPDLEEDLDDFLATLKGLTEAERGPASFTAESWRSQAGLEELVRQELTSFLHSSRFSEIVQTEVQKTVEKITRELLPQIAAQVLERKIAALVKRLAEEEE